MSVVSNLKKITSSSISEKEYKKCNEILRKYLTERENGYNCSLANWAMSKDTKEIK